MWPAFITGAGRIEVSRRIVPASLEEPQVPSGDNIIGKARRVNVMQWDWLFSGGRERFSGRLEGGGFALRRAD